MIWSIGLVAGAAVASLASPMTLAEAEALAVQNAFSVRAAQTNVEKAAQVTKQAQGIYAPKFQVEGTYQRYNEKIGGMPSVGVPGYIDSKQASGSLVFPLDIVGIGRKSVRAAKLSESAQTLGLEAEKRAILNTVRDAYYGVLRAQEQLKVSREALLSSEGRLQVANQKLAVGSLAKYDVLRFETDVTRARASVIDAENGVKLAKNALNSVLARPIDTEFEVVEIADLSTLKTPGEELLRSAPGLRPEVRAGELRVQALALQRQTEEKGLQPSLSLSAVHNLTIDPPPTSKENLTVGVLNLTIPLFDSGITRARVQAARKDEEQAQIQLEQLKLGVSLQVRQALTRLDNAQKQLEVAQKNVEQETEAMRVANLRFEEGMGITLDVITQQESLTRAKVGLVNARYQYLSAFAELQRAVGVDELNELPKPAMEDARK